MSTTPLQYNNCDPPRSGFWTSRTSKSKTISNWLSLCKRGKLQVCLLSFHVGESFKHDIQSLPIGAISTTTNQVLSYDAKNVKALYRRGQSYKELRLLDEVVTYLSREHEFSPDDDTIAEVLRDAECSLKEGGNRTETSSGLIIEDITEEVDNISSKNSGTSSLGGSRKQLHEISQPSRAQDKSEADKSATNLEYLQKLKDDPGTVRFMLSLRKRR